MLKIRLMRIGAKKRPFYRVVVIDERNNRNGAYIENVGTYDPMTTPHTINLKQDRIDEWVKKGAQLSDGFLRIIGKAPQRPPRKTKRPSDGGKKEKEPSIKQQEPNKGGDDITASADQPLSEPVANEESDASLTGENGDTEPTQEQASEGATEEEIAASPEAPRNDESEEQK